MLQRKLRRWKYLTPDEVKEFGKINDTESVWHEELKNPMMVTDTRLAGRDLKFIFDNGEEWSYHFKDERHLAWSVNDGRKSDEDIYNASPAPGYNDLIQIHHYKSGQEYPGSVDLYMDFESGYAVIIDASLGQPDNPREVWHNILFGQIEGVKLNNYIAKPHFTNELTGKAVRWRHPGSDSEGIKYIFSCAQYYTYAMKYQATGLCWMATNPADYIKLRENLYVVSVIEERQTGVQLDMMMNMELLTDVQTEFGLGGPDEQNSYLETFMRSGREGILDTMDTDMSVVKGIRV